MARKRKRKLKLGNIFLFLALILLFGLVIVYGKDNILKSTKASNDKNLLKDLVEKKETKEEDKTYEATVITAGDNLIHSSVYKDANRLAGYSGYDFKPMYELIKPIVSKYDIAYYNQESILGGTELGLSDYPTFNSPQEAWTQESVQF